MDLIDLIARLALAAVFAVSGAAKLGDREGARQAIVDFRVPRALARPGALLVPVIELTIALLLIPNPTAWWGSCAALAVLGLFTLTIGGNLIAGRRPECHCFGRLGGGPIGWRSLARNAVLIVVAALVAWRRRADAAPIGNPPPAMSIGLALQAATLALFAVQAWFTHEWLTRREVLATGHAAVQPAFGRVPAGSGLGIGEPAPEFRLPDLAGTPTTLADLRSAGRPVLLVFVNAGCQACLALLPELAAWQRDHAARFTLAVAAGGSPADLRAVAATHNLDRVLRQESGEVSRMYRVRTTPSGIVVRPHGAVGSDLAEGAPAIRALMEPLLGPGRRG